MKRAALALLVLAFIGTMPVTGSADYDTAKQCLPGLDQDFRRLHSNERLNLCEKFANQPMLIVNTASHCGFTPQFESLEAIHRRYADRGLVVIGFPSNDFNQGAADESKAAKVCYINYGVSFTMVAPVKVKDPDAHPVFQHLAAESRGPTWNFTKYLISRDGQMIQRFGSSVKPDSRTITDAIESLL